MTFEERNETELSPDDPRITAYAFGELEGDERASMEAAVARDPALRAAVAELRAFGGELGATLADELATGPEKSLHAAADRARNRGRVLRFPVWAWAAAGFAAAAGVAVMLSLQENASPAAQPPVAAVPKASAIAATSPLPPASPRSFEAMTPSGVAFNLDPMKVGTISDPAPKPATTGETNFMEVTTDNLFGMFGNRAALAEGGANEQPATRVLVIDPGSRARDEARTKMLQEVAKAWRHSGVVAANEAPQGVLATNRSSGDLAFGASSRSDYVFGSAVALPAASAPVAPVTYENLPVAAMPAPPPAMPHGILRSPYVAEGDWKKTPGSPAATLGLAFAERSQETESYAGIRENGFIETEAEPLSTFSIDVDTASYANVRRFLQGGQLPPRDAVRIEELVNYFPYRYAAPEARGDVPFAANLAVASAPWAPAHRLVRIGIKGRELGAAARPPANLVFLVDVSGSMTAENKLPLVKASLRQLLGQLRGDDRVAIVTYAGASGLALPSTPAARGGEILDALDRLESGGSTNGGMGIHLAYDIAKANFVTDGLNRVILCTDGDFNVGVTDREELLALIREKARSRVFLTVLGFGMGNLKDGTLEQLADKGNGAYGYIDSRREARKVFVEQVEGTLAAIAKDVKIQVEFNPARVASYRLIGYENRVLAKEDFNNDTVDAGEVGAGHTVTALYEIVPAGSAAGGDDPAPEVDPLKYGPKKKAAAARRPSAGETGSDELLTVKIRYKEPAGDVSRKLEFPLVDQGADFAAADGEFKFAAAVAAWGMWLRGSPHTGATNIERVLAWAEDGLGNDPEGHRAEFVELARRSGGLKE